MVFDRRGCIRILRTRREPLMASWQRCLIQAGLAQPGNGRDVVATQDPRPWIPEITQ
jgi:hypothetical protein